MSHVARRTVLLGLCVLAGVSTAAHAQAVVRGGGASGFTANSLPANDDESTGLVDLGFTANFFGTSYSQLYVNNNGNVTFAAPLPTYTPFALTGSTSNPIIAAFFADVDTRGGSALTQYGTGTIDGHNAFGVNWDGVGYFGIHTDKLNVFQEILIDRSDTGAGNFDIQFNYDQVQWETGDASDGVDGFGGTPAAVGYSSGSGTPGTYAQLSGSFVSHALTDDGPASTSLIRNGQGSAVLGRYVYTVREGQVLTTPEPATLALVGAGIAGLLGVARTRRRTA